LAGDTPVAVVSGDFNGDGRIDLAVANEYPNTVSVLLGKGDGTFQAQPPDAVGPLPFDLVTGDFNGGGRMGLAVANFRSADYAMNSAFGLAVPVLLGNGDGSFQAQVPFAVGTRPVALVSGEFNGDGRTDLAVANSADNTVSVLLGNGDGTFQTQTTYAVGTGPTAVVTGDF